MGVELFKSLKTDGIFRFLDLSQSSWLFEFEVVIVLFQRFSTQQLEGHGKQVPRTKRPKASYGVLGSHSKDSALQFSKAEGRARGGVS